MPEEYALPAFVQKTTEWLASDDNKALINRLRKETAVRDLLVRRFEVKKDNELQASLRPKLREVDSFWPYALSRNTRFNRVCTAADDLDALSYLTDLELKIDEEDPREFDLIFTFAPNPYFSNSTLTKSYKLPATENAGTSSKVTMDGEGITDDMLNFSPEELETSATEINWKSPDKNLSALHPRQMPAEDDDEDEFEGDLGSWFLWFESPRDEYELGIEFAMEIIPKVVDTFLGLASGCDSDEELDSEDEEEAEEEDDLAEEVDLEEEERRPRKRNRAGKIL